MINHVCVKLMAMSDKSSFQGYFQRFPLVSWLGILLCFVLFPAGLINLGLDQLFRIRSANNRQEIAGKMEHALKTVEKFSDNEYFSHYLLLEINRRALASRQPEKTFGTLKKQLQSRYPGAFTFVYWNARGDLVKEVSDETSFGYIIRKTYHFLKRASELLGKWEENSDEVSLVTLGDVEKEAKILRNFLGKLMVIYQLRYPWMSGQQGKPLQTSPPGPRSRIWYRINDAFGFLCFINDEFIQSSAGSEYALNLVRRDMPDFKVHLTDYPASEDFFPPADAALAPKLVQALSRFESMSVADFEEFSDILVGCMMVGQSQRAVCYCSSDLLFSEQRERLHYFGSFAKVLLPLLFLLMVWYKTRWSGFVSIRLKLTVIFLYAGGIPLLIMGSIGLEYLEQKRQQLVYEAQTRGINVLYGIDRNFKIFLEDHATHLSELINGYNKRFGLEILQSPTLKQLRAELMGDYRPESIQLYNHTGQNLVADNRRTIFSDYTLASQLAMEILHSLSRSVGKDTGRSFIVTDQLGVNVVSKKKEISFIGLGAHELYFYFEFLGIPEKYQNLAMLQLYWRKENLQRSFFERFHAANLAENMSAGAEIIAYYPSDDLISCEHTDRDNLKALGQYAYNNQIIRKGNLSLSAGDYTAVGMRGLNMDQISLLYMLPVRHMEELIGKLGWQMAAVAGMFLLLTFMMFRYLASHFLAPVGEIQNAISSIGRRDFSYRLAIDSSLEFSELSQTFNATLETFKDLETARIVQESLFPPGEANVGDIRLVAFSQPFSRIGGDYYDFFTVENQLLVFIGDVSGHGISAALIMAMAKATMIDEKANFTDMRKLADAIDQTVFLNRKSGTREYMTGLFFMAEPETGRCQLINRGHCMPVIIDAAGKVSALVKSGGLPLGYNSPEFNQPVTIQLNPGETLCLHTDGFAEAAGKKRQVLGYQGLQQMLATSWHVDVDRFLQTLLKNHNEWAESQSDDQTVILIKRS